jgi:DNA-binding SARP family transcriptional activator
VWGGSNDVGKNEVKQGIHRIQNFVETNKHTNVILMEAPFSHDLTQDSCANKEVGKFNSKLRKCMKVYENAEMIKVNSSLD